MNYLISVPEDSYPVFPNIWYLIILIIFEIFLTLTANRRDCKVFSIKNFINRHLLALIPPFLAAKVLQGRIKFEKKRGNDQFFILSQIILKYLFILIGILFLVIVLFSVLWLGEFKILFLTYSSSLGIIGFSIGDMLSQEIDKSSNSDIKNFIEINLLSRIIDTTNKRIYLAFFSIFIALILLILDLQAVFPVLVS